MVVRKRDCEGTPKVVAGRYGAGSGFGLLAADRIKDSPSEWWPGLDEQFQAAGSGEGDLVFVEALTVEVGREQAGEGAVGDDGDEDGSVRESGASLAAGGNKARRYGEEGGVAEPLAVEVEGDRAAVGDGRAAETEAAGALAEGDVVAGGFRGFQVAGGLVVSGLEGAGRFVRLDRDVDAQGAALERE